MRCSLLMQALTSSFIKPASNRSCLFAAQVATAEPDMVASNQSSDERLAKFRELLAKADKGKGVDAYIIPTEDPHMVLQNCPVAQTCIQHLDKTCKTAIQTCCLSESFAAAKTQDLFRIRGKHLCLGKFCDPVRTVLSVSLESGLQGYGLFEIL